MTVENLNDGDRCSAEKTPNKVELRVRRADFSCLEPAHCSRYRSTLTWIQVDSVDACFKRQSIVYQDELDAPVARKLVPAPTKKLNKIGTARLALTSMLHPSISVEAIVTLFQVSTPQRPPRPGHPPGLIRKEDESRAFQPEIIRTSPVITADSLLFLPVRSVHEAPSDQGRKPCTHAIGYIANTDDDGIQAVLSVQ